MAKNQKQNKLITSLLISNLLTPCTILNKSLIINFLSEVYSTIFKRSNRTFNSYTFQEYIKLPMFISDKIYNSFTNNEKSLISESQFTNGLYCLLYEEFEKKVENCFRILDFTNSSVIYSSDVFIIMSHFHLIENTNETFSYLEKVIEHFFDGQEIMNYETFFIKCTKTNCDIPILFIIFINNYVDLFQKKELLLYQKIIKFQPSQILSTFSQTPPSQIPHSKELIDYLELISFNNKNKILEKNSKSTKSIETTPEFSDIDSIILTDSEEEKELDELNNFEKDIVQTMSKIKNGASLPTKFESKKTFSLEKYPTHNKKVILNKEMEFSNKKKDTSNILKVPGMGSSYEDSSNLFCKLNTTAKGSSIGSSFRSCYFSKVTSRKSHYSTQISYSPSAYAKFQKTTENSSSSKTLYLFKVKDEIKTNKKIKLILVNNYIFYFVRSKQKYQFKKIIPVFSIFPKKSLYHKKSYQISLISNVHNFILTYSFISDDKEEEINDFINHINMLNNNYSIHSDFQLGAEIGKGKFGTVMFGKSTKISLDNKYENYDSTYAIKMIKKGASCDEEYKINRWESSIFSTLSNFHHPNIIRCYKKYETVQHFYFVYEYIEGTDLKVFIKNNRENRRKINIGQLTKQLLQGIWGLHKLGIIHRDIKTTNIMIDINQNIKILDFGLSRVLGIKETSSDPYGSLSFKAPEILLQKPYNFKVDIWALGVTLYYMVFKHLPFEKGTKIEIKKSIINDVIVFSGNDLYYSDNNNISSPFIFPLITECLERNTDSRPTIKQLLEKYNEDDYYI